MRRACSALRSSLSLRIIRRLMRRDLLAVAFAVEVNLPGSRKPSGIPAPCLVGRNCWMLAAGMDLTAFVKSRGAGTLTHSTVTCRGLYGNSPVFVVANFA